jgi:Spy/CpxP family protein refolding chaperone
MRHRIIAGAFVAAAGSVAVVIAQHPTAHQPAQHSSRPSHAVCGMHHATASDATQQHSSRLHAGSQHHAAAPSSHGGDVIAALKLNQHQAAEIDRLATEACAAMSKYHEQIVAVLTPEQRAKMNEMHAQGHADSPLAAFFKRLHGGK